MTVYDFEKYLQKRKPMDFEEEFWDKRSVSFAKKFSKLEEARDDFVFDTLEKEGISSDISSIIDLGCGVGRHAYYFNKLVENYLGIDSSMGMIEQSHFNKKKYGLNNCNFIKSSLQKFEGRADLVFAAMCPGIRTVLDIEKMLDISDRYVMIKRFLSDRDSLLDVLDLSQNMAHNDADYSYGLINIFWNLGYYPQIFVDQFTNEKSYNYDESLSAYASVLNRLDEKEKEKKSNLLSKVYREKGEIQSIKTTTVMIILVDKRLKYK